MPEADRPGRPNQKRRTRKDLLDAAARLMKQGRRPSFEDIAEEALVSRATAYRYFPNLEALLREAALDVAAPEAAVLFKDRSGDPVSRVQQVDEAFHRMVLENEAPLRLMLAHSLERKATGDQDDAVPSRQNRRTPLIEAALEPFRKEFRQKDLDKLVPALALIIGTEGVVVLKDVLQLSDAEGRKIKRWAIEALVEAARKAD